MAWVVEGGGQYGEFDDAKNKLDDVFIRVFRKVKSVLGKQ